MENESTVNAEQVETVTPQETIEVEQTESVQSEVATDTASKTEVEQSPEENAKFKELRLKYEREKQEAEQKSLDKFIAETYGEKYGIHTKADYDKAMREQKQSEMLEQMRNEEVDPKEIYKALRENDPEYQELSKMKAEIYTQNQLKELNAELKELDLDVQINTLDDIAMLDNADKIIKHIESGKTLSEAYFLANKGELIKKEAEKVRQDTIKKIQANGDATTGSLSNNGQTTTLYTREQVDAMSQADVNKNYDLVIKSMKTWK